MSILAVIVKIQLEKRCVRLQTRDTSYQAKIRKKEVEYEKLKERLQNKQYNNREFNSILRYLQSKRGFHQHHWSVYRSAWSIPYNPNEIITLKDKLKDLNRLQKSIITSHAFQTFDWLADV